MAAILIVVFAGLLAPMGVLFNTKMYEAGEEIMLDANSTLSQINDSNVRNTLYDTFSGGLNAVEDNIEVNNGIFQYGWIITLVLTGLISFMVTRSLVEFQTGGGFV